MAVPQFRLKRTVGGVTTVLTTWTPPSQTVDGTVNYNPAGSAVRTFLDVPGGAATYTIEIFGDTGTVVAHRSILVQGVMR